MIYYYMPNADDKPNVNYIFNKNNFFLDISDFFPPEGLWDWNMLAYVTLQFVHTVDCSGAALKIQ